MADISVIKGINFDDGTERLLSVFGGSLGYLNSGTWSWQGLSMSGSDFQIAKSNNYGYVYGGMSNAPKTVNSSMSLSTTNVAMSPWAQHVQPFRSRVFVGKCYLPRIEQYFRRRVFYTDIIEKDDGVVWGLEYQKDLYQTINSRRVTSPNANFITNGIKSGDPMVIFTGANEGVHAVREVISETEIDLETELLHTDSYDSYLVGGNWFDLDSDVVALNEHYGVLLAFEYSKVWRWSPSIGFKEMFGVQGTNTWKSVVRHQGYTFWYHPSEGFMRFDGSSAENFSDKISQVVDSITDGTQPVGWIGTGKYKNHVYWYVGDVTITRNAPYNDITLSNCVVDFNIKRERWKIHEYPFEVTTASDWVESGVQSSYLGTSSSMVIKQNSGNSDYDITSDDGSVLPIEFYAQSYPVFPGGPEIMCNFIKLMAFLEHGTGIKFQFRLTGTPSNSESDWSDILEINKLYQESRLKEGVARGIEWRISWIGTDSFLLIGLSFIWQLIGEAYDEELS